MEKAKCCEEFWIFCAERAKFRSDFPILSLAAAKSPSHPFQPSARFPKFGGVTAIYSVSANFPSQKSGSPTGLRRGSPPGRNRKPNLRRAARVSLFPNKKCERPQHSPKARGCTSSGDDPSRTTLRRDFARVSRSQRNFTVLDQSVTFWI